MTWCKANDPDLVIVGYMMPGLNGIEFTEHFRQLAGKEDTPVLMVTASTDREVRNRAFENGVNDFLNKPYDSVELQARVSNMLVLRSKQAQRAKRPAFRPDESSKRPASADRPHENNGRLLDTEMTLKRLAGDDALLNQVARVFIRTVPQLLKDIGSALAAKDSDRAYAEAHSLKGAVAVLEAPEVLASIVVLETHAINYNADAAATSLVAAQTMVTRLCVELQSLLDGDVQAADS
jgi:CheY-like chemotaxis protein/HPt (histidine-containing phosphotransfer) domain-containing protein